MSEQAASKWNRAAGVALVAVGAVAFATKAIFAKLAYRHGADALAVLALRMIFSAPLFALIAAWARRTKPLPVSRPDALRLVFLGTIGYHVSSYFDFVGLQYISASLERLLFFVHPTFVVLLSAIFFRRRVPVRDICAIAISYCGIALLVMRSDTLQSSNALQGCAGVLFSAVLYATYLIVSSRVVHRVGPMRLAAYIGLVACAAMVIQYAIARGMATLRQYSPEVYGYTMGMAAISTVLPIVLTAEGVRRLGASHASIIGATGPIATIFLGALFLAESITTSQIVGAVLVLIGVVWISMPNTPAVAEAHALPKN